MVNELEKSSWFFETKGLFLLINQLLLFQYSKAFCSISRKIVALKDAQNDNVLILFLTG